MFEDFMKFYYGGNFSPKKNNIINKIEELIDKRHKNAINKDDGDSQSIIFDLNNMTDETLSKIPEEMRDMVKAIKAIKDESEARNMDPDEIENMINNELSRTFGEAHSGNEFDEDDMHISSKKWNLDKSEAKAKILNRNLNDAIANEDYIKAAKIRDEINSLENQSVKKKSKE